MTWPWGDIQPHRWPPLMKQQDKRAQLYPNSSLNQSLQTASQYPEWHYKNMAFT